MKLHLTILIAALALPVLHSCNGYSGAGYAKARVHYRTAPGAAAASRAAQPAPAAVPLAPRTAAPAAPATTPAPVATTPPAAAPTTQSRVAPQAVPSQGPIPEYLLEPVPHASPSPGPASDKVQSCPSRDYPVMPGQNRSLKII